MAHNERSTIDASSHTRTGAPDAQRVRALVDGYQNTCVLVAASRLGLFNRLANEFKDPLVLAGETGVPEDGLRRLLCALSALGILEWRDGSAGLTDEGRLLSSHEAGLGALLELVAGQYLPTWSALDTAVATAEAVFPSLFGASPWEHRRAQPRLNAAFTAMTRTTPRVAACIADSYDLSGYRRAVDVGGGLGYLLAALLRRHPSMTGVLFDQPHVVEGATATLGEACVLDRCEIVGGSFFNGVPKGGDLYLLQYVLHDWTDERAVAVLRQCRAAMDRDNTLLILEKVAPENGEAISPALAMRDLHMLVMFGGRERTLREYDALSEASGLTRISHTALPPFAPDILELRCSPEAKESPRCYRRNRTNC